MVVKCIVEIPGLRGVTQAAIHDCAAAYMRVVDRHGAVMVDRTDEELDFVISMAGTIPLIVEVVPPLTPKMIEIFQRNKKFMTVCSEDRVLLRELFIIDPSISLGITQRKNEYVGLTDQDFFIEFVVVYYENLNGEVIGTWREDHPRLKIIARDIYKPSLQVSNCMLWRLEGMTTQKPGEVQKVIEELKDGHYLT